MASGASLQHFSAVARENRFETAVAAAGLEQEEVRREGWRRCRVPVERARRSVEMNERLAGLELLAQWGGGGSCDFDGGGIGINDFLELLANWGPCP